MYERINENQRLLQAELKERLRKTLDCPSLVTLQPWVCAAWVVWGNRQWNDHGFRCVNSKYDKKERIYAKAEKRKQTQNKNQINEEIQHDKAKVIESPETVVKTFHTTATPLPLMTPPTEPPIPLGGQLEGGFN